MNNEYFMGNNGYAPSYISSRMQPNNTSNIMWTMGVEGAKAFPISPGKTVLLMDSETSKFYVKTMDINGYATLKTYTFTEEEIVAPQTNYVTKEELEAALSSVLAQVAAKSSPETSKNLL